MNEQIEKLIEAIIASGVAPEFHVVDFDDLSLSPDELDLSGDGFSNYMDAVMYRNLLSASDDVIVAWKGVGIRVIAESEDYSGPWATFSTSYSESDIEKKRSFWRKTLQYAAKSAFPKLEAQLN